MQLSDAIALGRVTIPNLESGKLSGCALGMAANAAGIGLCYHFLERKWPWLKMNIADPSCCPDINRGRRASEMVIWHLFDHHVMRVSDWTLDQLIDWVRANEPAEAVEVHAEEKTIAELVPSLVAQG